MTTRDEALRNASRALAEGMHRVLNNGTPREAAERAHTPGGPSVDELEARITKLRTIAFERNAA